MRKAITHSVDPDDLAARLAQVPSERGSPMRHMSPTALSEDTEFEAKVGRQEYQARCYQALLEEGGRPLFHIELLPQISANVDEYHDLLRPWRLYPDSPHHDDWELFHRQIIRWQEFRVSQLWHRGCTFGFSEYLDQQRRHEHMLGGASKSIYGAEYEQMQRRRWEREHGQWQQRQYDTDDEAKAAFLEYNNAMKKLLKHYGFVQPFQLHPDVRQQDQLTTFVEYLGFEYHHLHLLTGSAQRMRPQPVAEREESAKAEVMAPSATNTTSQHKRIYEPEGTTTATDDQKEMHGQTAREQKRLKMRVGQGLADQEQKMPQSNPAHSRAARAREQKYQEAKARVTYHQYRVEWILSEISKIEAEQKSTGESASLVETKNCERKPTSDANMDTPIVEPGRTEEEEMANRKSDNSPTAQVVKLKVSEEEAVPKSQVKANNTPSTEGHSCFKSKKASTQFRNKDGDVDLESAVAVSAQVSPAATGDSQETCNDQLETLRPSANGEVAITASTSTEVNKTPAKKESKPSHASEII